MSYLSHVAIFYNKGNINLPAQVFEAMMGGVNRYDLGRNWGNDYLFSVRRIGNTSATKIANAVDASVSRWERSKFRPDLYTPNEGSTRPENLRIDQKIGYYKEWADKHNTSGIYCSKLVWLTFKDTSNDNGEKIDLDSNATRAKSNVPGSWLLFAADKGNNGTIWNAFIGVSPDDIYDSKYLDSSFFFYKDSVLEVNEGG
ncbi:MAG: hypothetical protein EXS67_02230 [Candidatus Margulisbacteria bacterium]|nr:hypothetical protein [Candidatus Margulisiibacteriota bacterium]